jgi:cytochrome c2
VFHDRSDAVDPRAIDIAAYLTESDSPVTPASDAQLLARGARLFTGLGCVACHVGPGVVDSDATLNRVPLKYVRAKFKTGALVDFLHKPEAHFAWIKMPNFHLSDGEATALASWLIASCPADALPPVTAHGDAENGKKLFATSGCLNCHATDQPTQHAVNGGELSGNNADRGCLADQVNKGVDFGFTSDQLQSLRAFVASNWKPTLQRDPPAEFATRQMSALRCTACHSMDAQDSAWSNLDGEIALIEQNLPPRGDDDPQPKGEQARPPLTWTGEKLQPGWMASFIAGKISYKPRPWLFARMPSFASRADLLSQGLALSHGCPATDELRPPVDAKLAEVGKQLVAQTGLGCVKCHAVADQAALAPFEAEAPNFAHVEARLRHDYFSHWMRNPQYFLPKTKMPSFADASGQTALKDILSGDATAEYEAIWNYLRAGEKIAPVQ